MQDEIALELWGCGFNQTGVIDSTGEDVVEPTLIDSKPRIEILWAGWADLFCSLPISSLKVTVDQSSPNKTGEKNYDILGNKTLEYQKLLNGLKESSVNFSRGSFGMETIEGVLVSEGNFRGTKIFNKEGVFINLYQEYETIVMAGNGWIGAILTGI